MDNLDLWISELKTSLGIIQGDESYNYSENCWSCDKPVTINIWGKNKLRRFKCKECVVEWRSTV